MKSWRRSGWKMWRRFQPNPDKITTGDCTVRAICAVTGMDWISAHTALCELSREMSDMPSENRVWWSFLRGIGFRQMFLPECPDCMTVAEFAALHPRGVYVLGPFGHAVAVISGDWWDAWDSGETVPLYFFVKEDNYVPTTADLAEPVYADDGAVSAAATTATTSAASTATTTVPHGASPRT